MSKNPNKQWDRCLYCDASIKGDDALVAEMHDPYCPYGKALVRLTRELDEATKAKAEYSAVANNLLGQVTEMKSLLIETVESENGLLSRCSELESRLAWHPVSEPPAERQNVLVHDGERFIVAWYHSEKVGFSGAHYFEAPTHWMPLPAAPNEAET